jgi:hypothetical protein
MYCWTLPALFRGKALFSAWQTPGKEEPIIETSENTSRAKSDTGFWAVRIGRPAATEVLRSPGDLKVPETAILMLLTLLALFTHGYHLGFDDEAVYLPAIKFHLDPSLYPHDSIFFMQQMGFTIYPEAMALLVRLSGLRLDLAIFIMHVLSIFLVLLGCLRLSKRMFASPEARWSSVTLIASLLTLPLAGTALLLVDQHLHPRSFTAAFTLFALVDVLDGKFLRACLWTSFAFMLNPLLTCPGAIFAAILAVRRLSASKTVREQLGPAFAVGAVSINDLWSEAARDYFYVSRWAWYELIGLVAPLAILFGVSRTRPSNTLPGFNLVVSQTPAFGLCFTALSLALLSAPSLERFVPLQPMRAMHIVYMIFFLVLGGLAGEYVLKRKPLRWALFFIPVFIVMFSVQIYRLSSSDHIEWPGMKSGNRWVQAFNWVRDNTPKDAFFALDPMYMDKDGPDVHGFRALADRSAMCDMVKDAAVVSVIFAAGEITGDRYVSASEIALKWHDQITALRGWKDFGPDDFRRLRDRFGVDWVILEKPGVDGLACLYENDAVMVCRIE